jgi:hypothetical protein
MAQEKDRAVRARKTTKSEPGAAAAKTEKTRATAKKGAAAKRPAPSAGEKAKAPTVRTSTAKTPARASKTTPRTSAAKRPARRSLTLTAVPEPTREEIAFRAYLLWEQGVPGDETEHWLRAEAELRAA